MRRKHTQQYAKDLRTKISYSDFLTSKVRHYTRAGKRTAPKLAGTSYANCSLDSPSSIRCLCLHPGSRVDPLTGYLEETFLENDTRFDAVSYVWGESRPTSKISFPDGSLPLFSNLDTMLRRLRLVDRPRWLWIDAICIDQHNAQERSSQVRIMGRIYSKAEKVIIWLGEETETSGEAFKMMHTVHEVIDASVLGSAPSFQQLLDAGLPNGNEPCWEHLGKLLEFCPWYASKLYSARQG